MIINENSLYSNSAERAALVADKEKVASAFFINVLGTLGIFAITSKRAAMKTHFQEDGKLRLHAIGDANKDVSLAIKLFHEVGGIRRSVADSLTKLLVNIKQKKIDHKNLNEQLIRDLVNNIQFNAHRPHPEVYKVVKAFANGELSLQQTGKEMYLTVKRKKKELLSVAGEFYELAKQYQPYFSNMKDATLTQAQSQIQAPAQVQQQTAVSPAPVAAAQVPTAVPVAAPTPKAPAKSEPEKKVWTDEEKFKILFELVKDKNVQRSGDLINAYTSRVGNDPEISRILADFFIPLGTTVQPSFLLEVPKYYGALWKIISAKEMKDVLSLKRPTHFPFFYFMASQDGVYYKGSTLEPEDYDRWLNKVPNEIYMAAQASPAIGKNPMDEVQAIFDKWADLILEKFGRDSTTDGYQDRFDKITDQYDHWVSVVGLPVDHVRLIEKVDVRSPKGLKFLIFYLSKERSRREEALAKLTKGAAMAGMTIKPKFNDQGDMVSISAPDWDGLMAGAIAKLRKWEASGNVKFTKPEADTPVGGKIDGWSGEWQKKYTSDFRTHIESVEFDAGENNESTANLYGDVVIAEFDPANGDQINLLTEYVQRVAVSMSTGGSSSKFKMAFLLRILVALNGAWRNGKYRGGDANYAFDLYLQSTGVIMGHYAQISPSIGKLIYALMKILESNDDFMDSLVDYVHTHLLHYNAGMYEYIVSRRPIVGERLTKWLVKENKWMAISERLGVFSKYLSHEDWRVMIESRKVVSGAHKGSALYSLIRATVKATNIQPVDVFEPQELKMALSEIIGPDSRDWMMSEDMEILETIAPTLKGEHQKAIGELFNESCFGGGSDGIRSYRKMEYFNSLLDREQIKAVLETQSDDVKDHVLRRMPAVYISSMPHADVDERLARALISDDHRMSWDSAAKALEKYGSAVGAESHKLIFMALANRNKNAASYYIKQVQESLVMTASSMKQNGFDALLNDSIAALDDKTQRHVYRELVREKAFGLMAHELYHGDSLVKPLKALTNEEIRGVMKYNDISFNVPAMSKKLSFAENVNAKAEKLQVEDQSIDQIQTSDEDLKRMSAHFDTFCNRKHGDIAVKFKRAFNVNLKSQQENYTKFLGEFAASNMDANVKVPMFHGCGTVAASMILRYGFKIIKMDRNAKGGVAMAGRALGDGIYFTNVLDKASLYVGDKGYNRGGHPGAKGYMFEMSCALGIPKKHTVGASTGSKYDIRRDFISPEWCARNLEQIVIHKAYEVEIITRGDMERIKKEVKAMSETNESEVVKDFKKFISESMDYKFRNQNATTFVFYDGMLPTEDGKVVAADKANLSLPKNAVMDWTKHGPSIIFYGGETTQAYDVEYIGDFANTSAGAHFYHLMGWKLPDEQ